MWTWIIVALTMLKNIHLSKLITKSSWNIDKTIFHIGQGNFSESHIQEVKSVEIPHLVQVPLMINFWKLQLA